MLGYGQSNSKTYRTKRLAVSDTVVIDSVSINPSRFKITTKSGQTIDSLLYKVDYAKGMIVFLNPIPTDSIEVAR